MKTETEEYRNSGYDIDLTSREEINETTPLPSSPFWKKALNSKSKKKYSSYGITGKNFFYLVFLVMFYIIYTNFNYLYFKNKLFFEKKHYFIFSESIKKHFSDIKKEKKELKIIQKKINCYDTQLARINKNLKTERDFCEKKK